VDEEIRRLRMNYARFVPVENDAIKPHDLLYGAMKTVLEGETIASDDNFEVFARDGLAGSVLLKGWGEKIVGRNLGDLVTTDGEIANDHENEAYRGKTAAFEFTVREIKRIEPAALDSAFLSSIGVESEGELRETYKDYLDSRLNSTIQRALRSQMGEYLIDHVEFAVPEGMSQSQTERLIKQRVLEMRQEGVPEAEAAKAADEMRTEYGKRAVRDLKLFFILQKIAEERDIEVDEEEMNSAIAAIGKRSNKRFDRVRDELSKGDGLLSLYISLRDAKVLDELVESAKITEVNGPRKD
jgi:trigger factor